MARRRYRRRFRRRSGRWAPNIIKISNQLQATSGEFASIETLAQNPTQTNTGVSQTFTVKNFEITFTLEAISQSGANALESITAYVMFVPQGMNVTSSYYAEHPEYILTYKYLGSPNLDSAGITGVNEGQQFQPYRIRSRLSRRLQTGDQIILFIQGSNQDSTTRAFNIDGIVRWWSKAN